MTSKVKFLMVVCFVVVLWMVCGVCSTCMAQEVITTSRVYLRTERDSNGVRAKVTIINSKGEEEAVIVPKDTKLNAISISGQWARVSYNGYDGYIFEDYWEVLLDAKAVYGYNLKALTWYDGRTNVRNSPNGSIIFSLSKNVEVIIVDEEEGWYQILVNNRYGYIRKDLLKVSSANNSEKESSKHKNQQDDDANWSVAYVKNARSNVRKLPSIDAKRITTLNPRETIMICDIGGDWYKVLVGKQVGYIRKDLVTKCRSDESLEDIDDDPSVTVIASRLNVRAIPDTSGEIVGSLKKGKKVTPIECIGDWYKIEWKGGYAYISSEFCS